MQTEQTRIRQQGCRVTKPANPTERINALRKIVATCEYAKIDGCMIDLFSASAIVKVFDALNVENQAKYANQPAPMMADIAFKLINRS